MRALTLHQPWASLIAAGLKEYETRSWAPSHAERGELIAIHAGAKVVQPDEAPELYEELGVVDLPMRSIVAVGKLASVDRTDHLRAILSPRERSYGDFSDGRYAWRFEHVRELVQMPGILDPLTGLITATATPNPIPCRGAQGLWTVPADVQAMVRLYLP